MQRFHCVQQLCAEYMRTDGRWNKKRRRKDSKNRYRVAAFATVAVGLQLYCHEISQDSDSQCVPRASLDLIVWIVIFGIGTLLIGGFVCDVLRKQTLEQTLPAHVYARHVAVPDFNKGKSLRLELQTLYREAKSVLAADDEYTDGDKGPKLDWFWLNTGCKLRSVMDHRNLAGWFKKEQLLKVCMPVYDWMAMCLHACVRLCAPWCLHLSRAHAGTHRAYCAHKCTRAGCRDSGGVNGELVPPVPW